MIIQVASRFICLSLALSVFAEEPEFVWNWAIRDACNVGTTQPITDYFGNKPKFDKKRYDVHSRDILWVESPFLHRFCRKVLPNIKHSCKLVISIGDETFPSQN